MSLQTIVVLLSYIAFAASEHVFWRQGCDTLVTEREDAIMSFGKSPSPHVHVFCGGSNLNPSVSSAQLRASECTSSTTVGDNSGYWVPAVYFLYKNGSVDLVEAGLTTYYHHDTANEETMFPEDFRMVAGNPTRTTFDPNSPADMAFEFLCLYDGDRTNTWPSPPQTCPGGLRIQFNFPSCWSGVTPPRNEPFDMAYPTDKPDSTNCPSSHPKRVPRIFTEVMLGAEKWYQIRDQALHPDQPFVFANGNREAYGLHGDFFMGWDANMLQTAFNQGANSAAGSIDANGGGVLKLNADSGKCKKTSQLTETISGHLPKLPGCNPIFDATTGYTPPTCDETVNDAGPAPGPAPGPAAAPSSGTPAPGPSTDAPAPGASTGAPVPAPSTDAVAPAPTGGVSAPATEAGGPAPSSSASFAGPPSPTGSADVDGALKDGEAIEQGSPTGTGAVALPSVGAVVQNTTTSPSTMRTVAALDAQVALEAGPDGPNGFTVVSRGSSTAPVPLAAAVGSRNSTASTLPTMKPVTPKTPTNGLTGGARRLSWRLY